MGDNVNDRFLALARKHSSAIAGSALHSSPRRLLRAAALLLLGSGCLLLTGTPAFGASSKSKVFAPEAYNDPTVGSKYVGSETCKGCHDEQYDKHFINTPHGVLAKKEHGCEDCHGAGSAHAESADKSKIVTFENLTPAQASARCMRCHQATAENQDFAQSVHLSQGVGCLSCHSPHQGKAAESLLVKKQTQLCYGCHAQQRAEFALPYRHRVDVGLIQCSDCHNPHGSFRDRQQREADGGMQICNKCHAEKMGPFVFEHQPVKQSGCTSCHFTHGSTNPRMLRVAQVNILCLQCHTADVNRPTQETPGAPLHDQSAKFQACTMCHAQIHGSNFSEFLLR
jgi:DmsE family decaheme c-type cytochrome